METTNETPEPKTGRATYSPEDNKLRLYIGRVPREEYERLRADGWKALYKQREAGGGDFVATWTPSRRATALEYADLIEDEDMGPEERAADRAERFSGYREKRTDEAISQADRYDAGPTAHGYQNQARAERAATRHNRIADYATDAWSKAEYWQRRTSGVINHALYKSSPSVRMGRIKTIESELRGVRKRLEIYAKTFKRWERILAEPDRAKQNAAAKYFADYEHGEYTHPTTGEKLSLYRIANDESVTGEKVAHLWLDKHSSPVSENILTHHLELRLAYENQMLEAQGGRAAFVEMEVGGFIGGQQIHKINRSAATGRIVSVNVMGKRRRFTKESGFTQEETRPCMVTVQTERLPENSYRPPTAEEKEAFLASVKEAKAKAPKKETLPLINPTDEDATRLLEIWNSELRKKHDAKNIYKSEAARAAHDREFKPSTIQRITQAIYSANSKGGHARAETRKLCSNGILEPRPRFYDYDAQKREAEARGPAVCQIRVTGYSPYHLIILTDKPQKPLPAKVWEKPFALQSA